MTSQAPGPPVGTDEFAAHHLPLVAHLVRDTLRRVPAAVDPCDLLAAGVLALRCAARGPARGRLFAEHASARAEHPRDPAAARARLRSALEGIADAEAAAAALGLDPDEAGADDVIAGALGMRVRGAGAEERAQRLQYVAVALEELPERLRHVLRGYFIEQRPIAVVAAQVGASAARAEQLLAEGLRLLRDALAAVDPAAEADPGPASGRATAYVRTVVARYAARSTPATVTEVAQRASA